MEAEVVFSVVFFEVVILRAMSKNPYTSPSASPAMEARAANDASGSSFAKPVFLAWERLRVLYVILLTVLSVSIVGPSGLTSAQSFIRLMEGAVAANLLFFAGPITETYIRWLGYNRPWVRWALFLGGTLLSSALAWGLLLTGLMADVD